MSRDEAGQHGEAIDVRAERLTDELFSRELSRRDVIVGGLAAASAVAFGRVGDALGSVGIPAQRRGGRLRVGVVGGGSVETFVTMHASTQADYARVRQVYETLTYYNDQGIITPNLASSVEVNKKGDEWTFRLPAGVEFHNGKTVTADDVLYTFRVHADPKNSSVVLSSLSEIDLARSRKLDNRTVRFKLKRPNRFFNENVGAWQAGIFPENQLETDKNFAKPVGTGPFRVERFTRGQEGTFSRFENYRQSGKPLLDDLVILSIGDPQARQNALVSNQVDLITSVTGSEYDRLTKRSGLRAFESQAATWIGMFMRTSGSDVGPFRDVRVRQALRLLVNRPQIVRNVFAGHARPGNDLSSWQDPSYPSKLPVRKYDPERARSLLKAAGQEDLTIELDTGNLTEGLLATCTLFAQQAKAGGVTVNLRTHPVDVYWGKVYGTKPFGSTYWTGRTYVSWCLNALAPDSVDNRAETRWANRKWLSVFQQALRAPTLPKARQLLRESQLLLYKEGGYILPAFPNFLDAGRANVRGIHKNPAINLGAFNFRDAYLA